MPHLSPPCCPEPTPSWEEYGAKGLRVKLDGFKHMLRELGFEASDLNTYLLLCISLNYEELK